MDEFSNFPFAPYLAGAYERRMKFAKDLASFRGPSRESTSNGRDLVVQFITSVYQMSNQMFLYREFSAVIFARSQTLRKVSITLEPVPFEPPSAVQGNVIETQVG